MGVEVGQDVADNKGSVIGVQQQPASGQVVQINVPPHLEPDIHMTTLWLEFLEKRQSSNTIPVPIHALLIVTAIYGGILLLVITYMIGLGRGL